MVLPGVGSLRGEAADAGTTTCLTLTGALELCRAWRLATTHSQLRVSQADRGRKRFYARTARQEDNVYLRKRSASAGPKQEDASCCGWRLLDSLSLTCAFHPPPTSAPVAAYPRSLVHVAKLREAALVYAQQKSARYFFSLDTDVMLTESTAISKLVRVRRPVVAPLLYAFPNNWDANIWEETHPGGGYRRGRFQLAFRSLRLRGCIKVQGTHLQTRGSAVPETAWAPVPSTARTLYHGHPCPSFWLGPELSL